MGQVIRFALGALFGAAAVYLYAWYLSSTPEPITAGGGSHADLQWQTNVTDTPQWTYTITG